MDETRARFNQRLGNDDMTDCRQEIINRGDKVVPRSCPTCKFGPCSKGLNDHHPRPTIGTFAMTDDLRLQRAENGGWIIYAKSKNPAYAGEVIGAYTSSSEMLDALRTALT